VHEARKVRREWSERGRLEISFGIALTNEVTSLPGRQREMQQSEEHRALRWQGGREMQRRGEWMSEA